VLWKYIHHQRNAARLSFLLKYPQRPSRQDLHSRHILRATPGLNRRLNLGEYISGPGHARIYELYAGMQREWIARELARDLESLRTHRQSTFKRSQSSPLIIPKVMELSKAIVKDSVNRGLKSRMSREQLKALGISRCTFLFSFLLSNQILTNSNFSSQNQ
jgi:hypothetical protein